MACPTLPAEIWLAVLEHLLLDELQNLSLTCHVLKDICTHALAHHRAMKQQLRHLVLPTGLDGLILHDLLHDFLCGQLEPSYVERLTCGPTIWTVDRQLDWQDPLGTGRTLEQCIPFQDELDKALFEKVCISTEDMSRRMGDCYGPDIYTDFWQGCEDAVLAILLPLLPNLTRLKLPCDIGNLSNIAPWGCWGEYPEGRAPVMPALRLVEWHVAHERFEVDGPVDECVANFAELPSIERLVVPAAHTWAFADQLWGHADHPRLHAREVFFLGGSVSAELAEDWADQFIGPCVFRQWWNHYSSDDQYFRTPDGQPGDSFEWDHITISGDIDPATGRVKPETRTQVTEKRYTQEQHLLYTWSGDEIVRRDPSADDDDVSSVFSDGMMAMFDGRVYELD